MFLDHQRETSHSQPHFIEIGKDSLSVPNCVISVSMTYVIRHTSASYLLADANIPIKAVQEMLGHKDYRTTMNIYGHALEKSKRAASDRFSELLKE
ncbi:tyrosine-type recombinase/integrase [Enterococcus casseliflavus]